MLYLFEEIPENISHGEQTKLARAVLLAALRLEHGIFALPEIAADGGGKPYFPARPDICFNYSHCRAGILAGIAKESIGVDIEAVRVFKESLTERICHPRELAAVKACAGKDRLLTRLWTAKEAYLKYTGQGIRADLRGLDMSGILADGRLEKEGAFLRQWTVGSVCLCACTREKEALVLQNIKI